MNTSKTVSGLSDIISPEGNPKRVCAEIAYSSNPLKDSFCDVHSDICPPKHCKEGLSDTEYREFLHGCLDEWLNKSEGTGYFIIGDSKQSVL